MKRFILFGAVPFLMAGCVPLLPLPISIVSSGLSGISLLATGKSTTDHVISAANKQDCIMHRIAFGEEMCRNYGVGEYRPDTEYTGQFPGDQEQHPQIADTPDFWDGENDTNTAEVPEKSEEKQEIDPLLISSLTNPSQIAGRGSLDLGGFLPTSVEPALDIEVGDWERPVTPIAVESIELAAPPTPRPSIASVVTEDVDLRFLSLGSFRSADRANRLMRRFAFLAPSVMKVKIKGQTWRRVTVGPMNRADIERLRQAHANVDGRKTWTFVQ
jgi:hypothetical protein